MQWASLRKAGAAGLRLLVGAGIWLVLARGTAAADEPTALQPYRVRVWLEFEPHPRLPESFREFVRNGFVNYCERFLGRLWQVSLTAPPPEAEGRQLPPPVVLQKLGEADKILWVRIRGTADGRPAGAPQVAVSVREYDAAFAQWGPLASRSLIPSERFPRDVFDLAYSQFRPTAVLLGSSKSDRVTANLRGSGLAGGESALPVAPPGTPFRVYRQYTTPQGAVSHDEIPWTYLVYRSRLARQHADELEIVSALRNPLSGRTRRRSRLVAIASGAAEGSETIVQYVTGAENRPLVGAQIGIRPHDKAAVVPIGATDRDGKVAVPAGSEPTAAPKGRLVHVVLRNGKAIQWSFPLAPGDREQLLVRVRIEPFLAEMDYRTAALQDEIVDVVARRNILDRRLRAYAKDENLRMARKIAAEINALPGKDGFVSRLQELKGYAEQTRQEKKQPILPASVNRLLMQTETLINEYLSGEQITIEIGEQPAVPAAETKPKE
jgi:hypothetical protein